MIRSVLHLFRHPLAPDAARRHAFALCCLLAAGLAQADTLSSSVDRNTVGENETLTLTISADDAGIAGNPDLAGLDSNFEILNAGSSSNTTIANGAITSKKTWRYTLAPKHSGKLLIPSFRLGSLHSDAIEIDVVPATASGNRSAPGAADAPDDSHNADAAGNHSDLFLDLSTDKREAYVQERIGLTLRIYTAVRIERPDIPDPVVPGMMVEKIGQSEYQARQGGRDYYVLEYRFALFANQSGTVTLPRQRYPINQILANGGRPLFDIPGFDAPDKQVRYLTTPSLDLHILPPPAGGQSQDWLPSEDVTITDNWPAEQRVDAGTPLTRTIEIRAQGNLASQIPPVPAPDLPGLKRYPEQPELRNDRAGDRLTGVRRESAALVPTAPGTIELPAIELPWWDTKHREWKTARLPARTLTVRGTAATTAASPAPAAPGVTSAASAGDAANLAGLVQAPAALPARLQSPRVWMATTTVFALLWIATLALLWRRRTLPAAHTTNTETGGTALPANRARTLAREACLQNDATAARRALLDWARAAWPDENVVTFDTIRRRSGDPQLATLLDELDAALYRGNSHWNGKLLAEHLAGQPPRGAAPSASALPGLYR